MKIVRIVRTPAGEAPEWVRREWVGLEFPLGKEPDKVAVSTGVLGGAPDAKNEGGYPVCTDVALRELLKKSPEATRWWFEHVPLNLYPYLVFGKQFCELIDPDEISIAE